MSVAAERIQSILREIEADVEVRSNKTAQEVAEILLREEGQMTDQDSKTAAEAVQPAANAPICDLHLMDEALQNVNATWPVAYYREFVRQGGLREKIAIFVKRVIRKLVRFLIEPITSELHAFHMSVTQTLNAMRNNDVVFDAHVRAIEQSNVQTDAQIQTAMDSLSQYTHSLQKTTEQVENLNAKTQEMDVLNKKIAELLDAQAQEIDALHQKIAELEAEQEQKNDAAQDYLDIDYFAFEDAFRGSRVQIKENQRTYLPHFAGCKNVLDLGSGRGEFLELLAENRITGTGVDVYTPFVDYCRMRGHTVVCADAVQFLRQQKDTTVDGIFAAQLVEHLSNRDLIDLCKESYRVLEKGKALVIETPNPLCLSTYMNSLYLDPTHSKPVHPKTLEYFLKKAGFETVEVVFTEQSKIGYRFPLLNAPADNLAEFNDGVNFLSDIIFGSQDYAIIAVK